MADYYLNSIQLLPSLSSTSSLLSIGVVVTVATAVFGLIDALPLRASASVHKPSSSCVLITGGSRGIGKCVANHLAALGFTVLVTVRKQEQYDELADKSDDTDAGKGGTVCPVLLDVTNDGQLGPAVERVAAVLKERQVELVAVVNNAGINPEYDAIKTSGDPVTGLAHPSVGAAVLETNVLGVARVTRALLPLLTTRSGRIVNVGSYFGSVAGKIGLGHAYYEASKFALEGLTTNLRVSLRTEGIRVSLIKPGNIRTDMNPLFGESDAIEVALAIEHAVTHPRSRARYFPGTVKGHSTRFICWCCEILPTAMVDRM